MSLRKRLMTEQNSSVTIHKSYLDCCWMIEQLGHTIVNHSKEPTQSSSNNSSLLFNFLIVLFAKTLERISFNRRKRKWIALWFCGKRPLTNIGKEEKNRVFFWKSGIEYIFPEIMWTLIDYFLPTNIIHIYEYDKITIFYVQNIVKNFNKFG